MELELNRIEYCSVGTVLPNAMKLLPTAYKQQQKVSAIEGSSVHSADHWFIRVLHFIQIAIGDQDGVVQVFSIKREDVQIHFKTLPAEKVQCLQLGGSLADRAFKIFVASDNKVRAFNKKGKVFLSFDTNMTEPIKSMFVSGNDLIICGNHVYNHYRDCKDIGSYLCGDTIVDVVALCPQNVSVLGKAWLTCWPATWINVNSLFSLYLSAELTNYHSAGMLQPGNSSARTLSRASIDRTE